MDGGYKQAKEDFVSGMTGSSITHVNLISLVALTSVALYAAIRTRTTPVPPRRPGLGLGIGMLFGTGSGFFAEWALLVLPMLLAMTLGAEYPYVVWMSVVLGGCVGWVMRMPRVERGGMLPSSQPGSPVAGVERVRQVGAAGPGAGGSTARGREREREMWGRETGTGKERGWEGKLPPLPALTTYRAHMMLMTVLAILAVDFPVFPRSLAKCETWGVSLMDLGVGSFVFSQGIVSAIPLVKDARHLHAPFVPKLLKVIRKSLPVIALGVVRVLLVKGTEYPEHVTEYGVHWNFFITLALLPVLQVFLHPLFVYMPISMVGVLVAIVQQMALSRSGLGLQDYVLHAPRASLVSMNKEGAVSLLGYLAIQLLGLSTGTIVLPPTPSFFSRRQEALAKASSSSSSSASGIRKRRNSDPIDSDEEEKEKLRDHDLDLAAPRQLDKTATELCAYSIMWWALLGVVRLGGVDGGWAKGEGGVSRRMVNISYILWVAAFNVSFLLCYLVVLDLWIYADGSAAPGSAKKESRQSLDVDATHISAPLMKMKMNENENPPRLLEVVNQYGLYVFLLANVLTGLINLSMSTMYMSNGRAMVVLSVYSMVCCGVPWVISNRSASAKGRVG